MMPAVSKDAKSCLFRMQEFQGWAFTAVRKIQGVASP